MTSRLAAPLVLALLVSFNLIFLALPAGRYDAVVVHHAAAETSDYRSIRRAHHGRGWWEIGYHFVLSNGSTDIPFGHLYATRRYALGLWSVATRSPRFNLTALHLCAVGNYETAPVPGRLQGALGHALQEIMRRHRIPPERILLHRDCSASACPGQHIDRDKLVAWARAGDGVAPEIKAQHRKALDRPRLSGATYGLVWGAVNLGTLSLFVHRRRRRAKSPESLDRRPGDWNPRAPGSLEPDRENAH
ncbi:MAG: peptidoglycan recognition family protein [Acidobacteriota bacterium]